MKKLILLIIFVIFLLNPISAKTIEEDLYDKKNIEVPGYNITLMGIGSTEKSVVVCVNNNLHIINKNNRLQLENLKIEPTRIYKDYIKLKITYSCEECICDKSCSNILCFGEQPLEQQESKPIQQVQEQQEEEQTQQKNNIQAISIILFIIVLILLITLLIKKRGR